MLTIDSIDAIVRADRQAFRTTRGKASTLHFSFAG
jgi:hypothetical protein